MRNRNRKTSRWLLLSLAVLLMVGTGPLHLPRPVSDVLVGARALAIVAGIAWLAWPAPGTLGRWRRTWRGWGPRKWPYTAGALLWLAGSGLGGYRATESAGDPVALAGFGLIALGLFWPAVISGVRAPTGTKVMIALAVAFLCAMPVVLVSLATNGSVSLTLREFENLTGWTSNGWSSRVEPFLLYLVPVLLIGSPQTLRSRVRPGAPGGPNTGAGQDAGVARVNRVLPGWIAAAAALMSGVYAVLLHFGGGPLARLSLPQLTVAVILAAIFLVPPYRLIARAVWNRGVAEAFDPGRWRADWRALGSDVSKTFSGRYVGAPQTWGLPVDAWPGSGPQSPALPRSGPGGRG